MIIELRKKSQVTIPKEIVSKLNLQEGDHLDVSIKDGVITLEPVAIYAKSYIQKLENSAMMLNEESNDYTVGPFKSVEDAIAYLEKYDKDDDQTDQNKKQ